MVIFAGVNVNNSSTIRCFGADLSKVRALTQDLAAELGGLSTAQIVLVDGALKRAG